jgi:hypothetical protein
MAKTGKRCLNMLVVGQKKTVLRDLYGYLSENSSWDPRRIEWDLRTMMTILMGLEQMSQNDYISLH